MTRERVSASDAIASATLSRRHFLARGSALLGVGAFISACGGSGQGGSSGSGAKGGPMHVEISTGKTVETANFFVADTQGFYKKHGLDAKLRSFTIPINGAEAMLAGTENVAELVELPFLTFLKNGADIIIVANTCTSRNIYLVTKDSIAGPSDLVGAKIGLPFSTGQQYAFAAYLEHVNVDASKVHLVNVQNENLVAGMSSHSIDGFLGIQPQVSQTLTQVKGTHIITNPPATAAYQSPEYLVLERSWAQQNRKAVQAILAALIDADSWIKSHKAETAKIMAPVMGLPASQVQTLMGPNPKGDADDYTVTLDQAKVAKSLTSVAQWMKSSGLANSVPDVSKVIDSSFLSAVDSSLVTGKA